MVNFPVDFHASKGKVLPDEAGDPKGMNDATTILKAMENRDAKSAEQLLGIRYQELLRLAAFKLSQQAPRPDAPADGLDSRSVAS
jgi:hypothetical protein